MMGGLYENGRPSHGSIRALLQALCVAQYLWFFLVSQLFALGVIIYLVFWTNYWWLVPLYFAWVYYDRHAPKRGARAWKFFQRMKIWRLAAEYFPLQLVKTADLDPSRNYILVCHPHGVLILGPILALATDAAGVYEKFPGIKIHGATLASNFIVPFRREYFLAIGSIDVAADSIEYVLSRPGGNAVGIVPGGAQESLESKPGVYKVMLRRRRGFVRIALKTGADLVPVIGFGEPDLYNQVDNPKGSLLRRFQDWLKDQIKFTLPVFYGNGLLPLRKPVTVVVGKPIRIERVDNPTAEEIESTHEKYIEALVALFEENKSKYADPGVKLEIM